MDTLLSEFMRRIFQSMYFASIRVASRLSSSLSALVFKGHSKASTTQLSRVSGPFSESAGISLSWLDGERTSSRSKSQDQSIPCHLIWFQGGCYIHQSDPNGRCRFCILGTFASGCGGMDRVDSIISICLTISYQLKHTLGLVAAEDNGQVDIPDMQLTRAS